MRQAKEIVKEMLLGLTAWLAVVLIILMIVAERRAAVAAGVLLGGLTAAGMVLHMYRHLDIALDMDAKHAQSHTQMAAMQRLFIMAAALTVSMLAYQYIHPVGMVLGLFGMKICAFLQPIMHRILQRKGRDMNSLGGK